MKATVIQVLPNQTFPKKSGGTFTATLFKILTDPKEYQGKKTPAEEKEYRVFTNKPYHALVLQLQKSDRVELKMVKNGSYWDIEDIILLEKSTSSGQIQQEQEVKSGGNTFTPEQKVSQEEIRQFAVGVSFGLVNTVFAGGGHFKKTASPSILVDAILDSADRITRYVKGEASLPEPEQLPLPADDGGGSEEDIPF